MIKLVRLDERMIHGQVAIKWSRPTGVDRIIVANNDAAANDIVKKSLMMAAPPTCKTVITTMEKSLELLNDPRAAGLKILLIVSSPEDLLTILKGLNDVKGIPTINIGNYGRIAPKVNGETRKTYGANLYAYDSEVELFKEIMAFGVETVYQTTPENVPEPLNKVLGL